MKHYVGLDVSLKEISVCVIDEEGCVVQRGDVASDPAAVGRFISDHGIKPERIVHESGQLSIWLQRGLTKLGLPATCIDARIAHKALSARLNKSDRTDAEGLAQLARTGWYTPVHVRSEDADRLRTLIAARERTQASRYDVKATEANRLPTVSVFANTDYNNALGSLRGVGGAKGRIAGADDDRVPGGHGLSPPAVS